MTLITNLLAADLVQASGMVVNAHWYMVDAIGSNRQVCTAQGIFIQIGDSVEAIFEVLIALHTFKHFIYPYDPKLERNLARLVMMSIWVWCILMALIPRFIHDDFFANAGEWCWISAKYNWSRFYLQYVYVFIAQWVSMFVYGGLAVHLWIHGNQTNSLEIRRVAKSMFAYPVAYTCVTLPLATIRVRFMLGKHVPKPALLAACILFSLLGTVNCTVYVLTRRRIFFGAEYRSKTTDSSTRPLSDTLVIRPSRLEEELDDDLELQLQTSKPTPAKFSMSTAASTPPLDTAKASLSE